MVPDFPFLLVTEEGEVFSTKQGLPRKLQPKNNRGGYPVIFFKYAGISLARPVHRLVLETFVGPRPVGMVACHANGDKQDNRLSNLRWDTQQNNVADTLVHGTRNRGQRNGRSKLTLKQVLEIYQALARGETQVSLAQRFKVSRSAIGEIKARRNWKGDCGGLKPPCPKP